MANKIQFFKEIILHSAQGRHMSAEQYSAYLDSLGDKAYYDLGFKIMKQLYKNKGLPIKVTLIHGKTVDFNSFHGDNVEKYIVEMESMEVFIPKIESPTFNSAGAPLDFNSGGYERVRAVLSEEEKPTPKPKGAIVKAVKSVTHYAVKTKALKCEYCEMLTFDRIYGKPMCASCAESNLLQIEKDIIRSIKAKLNYENKPKADEVPKLQP